MGPHTPAVSCMLPRAATSRSTAQLPETRTSPPAAQSLPAALLHRVGLAEASPGPFIVSGACGQLSAWPRCVSLSVSVLGHAVNPYRAGSPVLLSLLSRSTPGAPAWRKGPAPRAVQRYPRLCRDVPCNEAQTPGEVHQWPQQQNALPTFGSSHPTDTISFFSVQDARSRSGTQASALSQRRHLMMTGRS